jgi:hypothetical protein
MATVSDITTTPLSGLNHIDALLDTGPDWNFLTPAGNTLYYTFSILSGNEAGQTGQEAFTLAQQVATRTAFDYISKLTGIQFVETVNGSDAQIHLCNTDLQGSNVTGLCSWHSSYTYSGANLVGYEADAYVYLDDVEWFSQNHNLTPGGYGYETLLHELGHALGLKHPFDDSIHLPSSQDNTNNTLMSYTSTGGPHSTYSQYDIAALKWLYGMDGLGGALGINSTTGARYITGTSGTDTLTGTAANDTLEGDGGNDMIDGGSGTDTAVFRGVRSNYTINALANGDLTVTSRDGIDGTDTLRSIEILKFSDMSASRADVVAAAADITAPNKPSLVVAKNAAGYAAGSTPLVNGKAEVGATITVYTNEHKKVGTACGRRNSTPSRMARVTSSSPPQPMRPAMCRRPATWRPSMSTLPRRPCRPISSRPARMAATRSRSRVPAKPAPSSNWCAAMTSSTCKRSHTPPSTPAAPGASTARRCRTAATRSA